MIAGLLHNLEAAFGWVLEASWQASVLVALVLLLQVSLRGRLNPRGYHALWLLVVLRLILPVLPESALSLFQFTPSAPPVIAHSVSEPIFVSAPIPQITASLPIEAPVPAYPFSFYTLLALVWLAGTLGLLVVTWLVNQRFARQVRSCPAIDDPRLLKIAAEAQADLGLRRSLRLIESAQVPGPAIMGLFHPVLILPRRVCVRFTDEELRFIFLHEFAHLKRGDLIVQWLIALLQTLHWFNPVLWYAFRRMRADREPATDALVLSRTGEAEKESYGQVLIKLLEHYHQRHSLPSLVGILEDKDQFKRRFLLIGKFTRGAYGWSLLGVVLIGILSVACLTKSKAKSVINAPSSNTSPTSGDSGHLVQQANLPGLKNSPTAKALVAAAQKGDLPTIRNLLAQGADPNANQDPDGRNALFAAAVGNQIEVVRLLLQNGADPNCKNGCGNEPINWVLDQGHLEMAAVLRDAGARISPEAWAGATGDLSALKALVDSDVLKKGHTGGAMNYAVSMGHLDAVKYLESIEGKPISGKFLAQAARSGNIPMMQYILDRGANIQTDGGNAMDQAVIFYDQVDAVKFLLAHGADPNRFSGWQQYTLAEATSATMVKVLLDGGANPNVEDIFGTPLSMAPDAESVRLLVQHGANLRPKLKSGISLIESVINRGLYDKPDVIDELIKQGAEFDPKGNGVSALLAAAQFNEVNTMKLLMDRGVSPNSYSDKPLSKSSALHNATWNPTPDALKLLLKRGANPSGDPRDENSPLAMSLICGQWNSADILRKAGAHDVGDLSIAAAMGDAAKVNDLLKNGASVNETDNAGNTPLYYAVRRAHVEIAELLIEHGANVNLFNSHGITAKSDLDLETSSVNPMQFKMDWGVSQEEGKRRAVALKALFAKYPSDPNYRNSHGWTALHQMAFSGNTMVGFLIWDKSHPADLNLQDNDGNTPLLLAALSPRARETATTISTIANDKTPQQKMKKWNTEAFIADQLIRAGAKLDLVVANGKTVGELAMAAAIKAQNPQLISVLQAASASNGGIVPISPDANPGPVVSPVDFQPIRWLKGKTALCACGWAVVGVEPNDDCEPIF